MFQLNPFTKEECVYQKYILRPMKRVFFILKQNNVMLDDYPYPELDSVVLTNRPFPSRQIEINDVK